MFELKLRARVGPEEKDDKEVRILNRIVRLHSKSILYEADPRHVEILTKSLGLQNSKSVCPPGVKDYTEADQLGDELDNDLVMMAKFPTM